MMRDADEVKERLRDVRAQDFIIHLVLRWILKRPSGRFPSLLTILICIITTFRHVHTARQYLAPIGV